MWIAESLLYSHLRRRQGRIILPDLLLLLKIIYFKYVPQIYEFYQGEHELKPNIQLPLSFLTLNRETMVIILHPGMSTYIKKQCW